MADVESATASTLTVRRVIAAPPERIFRAWTDPAQLKNWFSPSEAVQIVSADIDARKGGAYRITLIGPQKIPFSVTGSYRKVRPFESLEFTWVWEDPELDVGETVVMIQLTSHGASTEIVLRHELLPTAEKRDAHSHGWNAILDALTTYIRTGE